MSIRLPTTAVLMCHAPIVIPAIGGARGRDCALTTAAMAVAARSVVASGVSRVVLLSPHLPRRAEAFSWKSGTRWVGSFAAFGRPDLKMAFEADLEAAEALAHVAARDRVPLDPSGDGPMDHGALVPLWFLGEAGYTGRVLILGFPWELGQGLAECFAMALGEAMDELEGPWGLVASGDMSHRLKAGAPSGYHPRAQDFDRAVVACVEAGTPGGVSGIPAGLRALAAEDVVESLQTAAPLLGGHRGGSRVLSYEGPFGVGYLVAILREEHP
nr:class III extradiol dioxygenase subunit B-like domain-containing protein [uncultured Holophaga sp.]